MKASLEIRNEGYFTSLISQEHIINNQPYVLKNLKKMKALLCSHPELKYDGNLLISFPF